MSSSYNYEKALSLEWNGQVYVLTVRNETPLAPISYLYSSDGQTWYSSSDLSNSQLLTQSNPYNVKWTGSNFAMIGNVANVSGNTILRSGTAATKFSALSTTGQGTNAPLYDLEANLEFPHTITFPRNTTLALGGAPADTTKIAYSLDAGITWTPSANSSAVFSTTANNAVWNGKLWVAVGQGGNTIATSVDGITWTGRGSYIFTVAGQGIAWSPQLALWVAAGQGTNSLAYSADGVYWTGLGTTMLGSGADVQWNGTIWSAVGGPNATNKSIAYSYDGKNWSNPTQTNLFDINGIKTAWNGYFWTAIGSSTPANNIYNIGTSVDGIFWFMQKNTNFSANITNMFTNPTATNEILFTTYGQVPGAPTALTYVSNNATSVSFSFTAPVGGVTPTSYTVSAVPASGQTVNQTFAYGGTTGTITGLTSATSYTISLYSNGSTGTSVASNSITTQTTLTPPTNLTFVSRTVTSIDISFTPPTVSGGVTITSYNATAVPVSGSTVISTGINGAGTSASITGLVASTQYSITLTATNSYGTSTSSTALVYQTALSPPYNLLASMVDTSSVSLSFVASTLGTSVSVTSYSATFVPTTGSTITVNNITSSPVAVNGLTFSMNYNITMVAINSYGTSAASATYNYTLTTLLVITGVASGSTGAGLIAGNVTNDVKSGTSTTNNITYNVYAFQPGTGILPSVATSSQATYTINYNTGGSTLIYVLAVGGGGGGGTFCGGGGGAGGVVMNPVTLPSGVGTISVNVGAGGLGQGTNGTNYATPVPVNGSNTTVSFSANTNANIIAYGGGFGQGLNNTTGAGNGGSGGGAGNNGGLLFGKAINQYNNYGNPGSLIGGASSQGCGGGGAGNVGTQNLVLASAASNGGPGIQCFLPGISTFAPSGTPYGTYYWGGGGGGGGNGGQSGNGGIGGGGGGGSSGSTTTYGGTGGGLALNAGGNGTYSNLAISGAGGTNTGGGGGGSVHNIAASGGSGIVVIALPSNMLITNNGAAVLPSSIYSSGFYNATLNNASLSAGAYSSIKGAYASRLLNYNYFGPVVTLRYSTDTTGSFTQNFYADICGNMGTGYLGTGQSVSSWLSSNSANTTYAFVTKWYGQGMDVSFNSATQYTTTAQPIYDVSYGIINLGNTSAGYGIAAPQTNCYFSLPNSTFPIGDASFSLVLSYFSSANTTNGMLFSAGTTGSNSANISLYLNSTANYYYSCWNDDYVFTPAPANTTSKTTVTLKYVPNAGAGICNAYVNGSSAVAASKTAVRAHATTGINNYIGYTPGYGGYINSSYGFLYIFGTALSDADRNIVEATPHTYSALPQMTITLSSIAATNFVATWANVTNASIYIAYINGTANGVVTSGLPITPGFGGPWATTIYAYDTNNKLLARGYVNAFVLSVNSVVAGSTGTGLIAGNPTTDVISGTSTTNGITYNVYSFQPGTSILPPASSSSQATYTINYTCGLATTIYVLAVGGGAGGNSGGGGGGGAGGVVMTPVSIPIGTSTITLAVGSGGASGTNTVGTNGYNTTVNFTANSTFNIIAYGGGNASKTGNGFTVNTVLGTAPSNNYINYANYGGGNTAATTGGGGGGGAGTAGNQGTTAVQYTGGNGGSGIQCFLPGITNFAPSGIPYGTYYWGGGGGGSSSTNANAANNGNGGIGGGGGGANATSPYVGGNGSVGLNNGGAGATNNGAGGSGGINTGGGGGGAWNGASGTGGSGIVIIAFPSNAAIANNQSAVLPSTLITSGQYKAVLNDASFSVGAYNSSKGAFGCRLLNYNYFGPIMTLRHSADTTGYYTKNFYSDICGNMGTGYFGTGLSLSSWLSANGANTTYAYVTKWYGQGMDVSFNSATQYTTTVQPIYDVSNGLMNIGYTGAGGGVISPNANNSYFNLPNASFPINDNSYNITSKMRNFTGYATVMSQGVNTNHRLTNQFLLNGKYCMSHFGNDFTTTITSAVNDTITFNYTGNNGIQTLYVNGSSVATYTSGTALAVDAANSYIANSTNASTGSSAIQLYYLYAFNSSLSSADRAIVEATPYQYSVLPTITGITSTTITANSFSLSWTAVGSVSYYMLWINGSFFATYNAPATTTGTVTYSVIGPWQINLYAYNASNVLLARGYMTTTIDLASASMSVNSGASITTNGANTVFTFNSSGTFTPLTSGYASVLIVGGGGSGGTGPAGGGGGAGGLIYFDASSRPMFLTAGTTYSVTVGAGGVNTVNGVNGSNGSDSVFNNYIAKGGGGGGFYNSGVNAPSGGCGGGGAYHLYQINNTTQPPGVSTQTAYPLAFYVGGYGGGVGSGNVGYTGGGGGGAGGVGQAGISTTSGGNGGAGYQCNITGINSYYGGGGGGSGYSGTQGLGGSGVGGAASSTTVTSFGGVDNTGSGGGGAGASGGTNIYGGPGGSGVVIISCSGIPTIPGLSATSVTATTFVLSWTAVANATSYILWLNGSSYGTVTSGQTITLSNTGPQNINLYAYNSTNNLLATDSTSIYPFTVSPTITNWQASDISGTSVSNGITYNVYVFKSTAASYTLNYTCASPSNIYVLAVGGGGAGGGGGGGGGGAGGVVMMPVQIPASSSTITINVGAGGAVPTATSIANKGSNTTVNFTAFTSSNITAYGGGGSNYGFNPWSGSNAMQGGSNGGYGWSGATFSGTTQYYTQISNNNNYGNQGGTSASGQTALPGGGGGAGTPGNTGTVTSTTTGLPGNGGNGIQCFLPGIDNFAPSGLAYKNYYWGGGGGAAGWTASYCISIGNGGLGGGGGGSNQSASPATVGAGGGSAINPGSYGANLSNGGNGGANTGGGGGGSWGNNGGAGGSGIVIIAFPQVSIKNNQIAVLPSTLALSGQYSAALNNVSFSLGAYNSMKGAFACRLLNYNYFGPIMTLRYSTDTTGYYTQNFYSDISGNMGTGYLGTGQSLSNWLSSNGANTTYAYVTKWYGQDMNVSFNSATQYTIGSQPIYEVATGIMNFGYVGIAPQTNCFFNLPDYALPYGDTSYTVTARHGVLNPGNNTAFISSTPGPSSNPTVDQNINFIGTWGDNTYRTLWWGDDFTTSATGSTNNVVTAKYTTGAGTNSRVLYINTSNIYTNTPGAVRKQLSTNNYIGTGTNTAFGPCNTQMYNLYVSNLALSDADRAIVEATPYQYSALATIAGLTSTTSTANSFSISWTAVGSVSYYILWINGSIFATYGAAVITTGTITHSSTGPWQINLYAYNASNVLLARGAMTTTIVMATASVSINSGATTAANGANTVFTFASSGTFTPITSGFASVLIVGGGGAGGANHAGGGGAGGLVYFDASSRPMFLTAGTTYTVTVGAGGAYNASATTAGSTANGGNSSINGYIASGGGGGGYTYLAGNTGGSGGGGGAGAAAGSTNASSVQAVYSAYYVGGNVGGQGATSTSPLWAEGGGGGAGAAGGNGITSTGGGAGGTGYPCNITGTTIYYGGGGGGGTFSGSGNAYFAPGGTGGGGNGGYYNTTPVWVPGGNGTNGLGGGGGGNNTAGGGNGGSGVVIILCSGIPAIPGLSASSVTATTFVLSWTTVTNAASYVLNINGTNYGSPYGVVTTTGTVTPGVSGPWTITLSAYNSSSVLLATSYLPTNSFNTISPNNQLFYYTFDTSTINSSYTLSSTITSGISGTNPTLANTASGTAVYDGNLSFTGGGPNAISTYISTTTLKNGTASLYCSGNFSFNFSWYKSAYSIGTNGLTFSWWMNTAMTTFSSPCVWTIGGGNSQNQNGSGQYGIWCQLNSATNLTFYTYNNSTNASVTLSATCSTITNGTWQYFCFTVNSSGTANVYQNNSNIVVNGTFYYPFTTSNINKWDTIGAGVNNGNFLSGNFYTGYIDNFRVYTRVITSSEASLLYLSSS